MSGKLVKLKFESFEDITYSTRIGNFEVLFNPKAYSQKYEVAYEETQAQGTTNNVKKYHLVKPAEYGLEFTLDGTGASAPKIDVAERVAEFIRLTGELQGSTHRPPYLKVGWGTLLIKGVLKTADIDYTLFRPDGFPLRAVVKVLLSVSEDESLRVARENRSSPDLTHLITVSAGDNLPLLAHRVYGDPAWYPHLARYNQLEHFRDLKPGSQLSFPPLTTLKDIADGQ